MNPTIRNPILRGMYPDPSLCRVGDTLYLATSTFEYLPGIPIHTSEDLENWRLAGHAVHDPSQFDFSGVGDSRGMFAPTLRHHEGVFYLACTQMDGGAISGNFYLTATDVAGPWSAPTLLPEARGIDPSLFFHDGRVWWIGCREVDPQAFEGETEVWMRELDLERGEFIGDESVIWTRTMARAVWAEAPHLYRRGDWFYLVTAEGGTAFEHSVMVARSRAVEGPYLPCPRNPVLTHRHLGHGAPVQYVGHADLFDDADGDWWMVMLATRQIEGHHVLGRETHLARVTWEDDWPVVNAGLGRLDAPVLRATSWSPDRPQVDDFLSVRGFATFAQSESGGLRLTSTGNDLTQQLPVASLFRRLTSIDSTVTVTVDDLDPEVVGGLVLRQSADVHVRLELSAGRVALIARNGTDELVGESSIDPGPVTLRAEFAPAGVRCSVLTARGTTADLGSVPLSAISTETAGGFVGTTLGVYATGPTGAGLLLTRWEQEDFS